MPADPRLLPLLREWIPDDSPTGPAIGRQEVWICIAARPIWGHLRTGVEDTFYMPDGSRCRGNGDLIEAMVKMAREVGREIASPAEAREMLHLRA